MGVTEVANRGQQRPDHGGGETADADRPGRFGGGVEVESGRVDGGQDRDRVVGKASAGGGQPDPPSHRLEQGSVDLPGEGGDLLGDGRGGQAELIGDPAHGPQAGQLHEQAQAADVHDLIVQD